MEKELRRKLRQKGFRLTQQRISVFQTLIHTPQRVEKIYKKIKKNISIDKVTIYRILDLYIQLGLVGKTVFKGKATHYELHSLSHHHHLICNTCDTVEDVSVKEDLFLKEIKRNTGFRIDSHHLEFFGTCAQCQ